MRKRWDGNETVGIVGFDFCYGWRVIKGAMPRGIFVVSSPDPPRPRPVGKLEREKRKEGLVNRHTTTCSSAGMLAELIKRHYQS